MNVEYSKPFLKAVDKLSGKVLSSVLDMNDPGSEER